MSEVENIIRKIHDRSIKIGIIGLGYVGLPLAVSFARKGIQCARLREEREEGRIGQRREELYRRHQGRGVHCHRKGREALRDDRFPSNRRMRRLDYLRTDAARQISRNPI